MKKYTSPEMNILALSSEDVITVSVMSVAFGNKTITLADSDFGDGNIDFSAW